MRTKALLALWLALAAPAQAATWYVGNFTGSSPADNGSCGTALATPCATLAFFNASRLPATGPTTVYLAPGTYGPTNNANHCILARPNTAYEGRNADGSQIAYTWNSIDFGNAPSQRPTTIIDMGSTPNSSPCSGQFVGCNGCNFHNFDMRALQLRNAMGGPGTPMWLNPQSCSGPGGRCESLDWQWIRITGSDDGSFGPMIGAWSDCSVSNDGGGAPTCQKLVRDVNITDSEFDNSAGDGLIIGDVRYFTIRNSVFRNIGDGCCNENATCSGSCGDAEDDDALNVFGGEYGWIVGSTGNMAAQGIFDFSRPSVNGNENCPASTRGITVERSAIVGNGGSYALTASGCAHELAWINNYIHYAGRCMNQYYGSCRLRVYGNTCITTDSGGDVIQLFQHHTEEDWRNNIFICNNSGGGVNGECLRIADDMVTTNAMNTWAGNLVQNLGSGGGMSIINFGGTDCAATVGDADYPCTNVGCNTAINANYADAASGLTSFTAASYPGLNFHVAHGTNEKWNQTPAFINFTNPTTPAAGPSSPANLHLQLSDTVARNAGNNITSAQTGGVCSASTSGPNRCTAGLWGRECNTNADCDYALDYDNDVRPQ